MTVRIGFDMDGVLADFSTAFREVEARLFGAATAVATEAPEVEAQHEDDAARQAAAARHRPRANRGGGAMRSGRKSTTPPISGPRSSRTTPTRSVASTR